MVAEHEHQQSLQTRVAQLDHRIAVLLLRWMALELVVKSLAENARQRLRLILLVQLQIPAGTLEHADTMIEIEVADCRHVHAAGKAAGDDCPCAGAADEIEVVA